MREYLSVNYGTGQCSFDASTFFFFQSTIALRYEDEPDLDIRRIGQKAFVDKYDKYILHAIEEIVEAVDSLRANRPTDESVEELVDIAMYIGSAQMLVSKARSLSFGESFTEPSFAFSKISVPSVGVDEIMIRVLANLVRQRMLFPQRKWHKPYTDLTQPQLRSALNDMTRLNRECIADVMQIILSLGASQDEVNRIINAKQDFIVGLPMVDGGETV